ncbi:MAG: glycerate kinase [Christensenellales bacterium]|jgi:glycerate kinase
MKIILAPDSFKGTFSSMEVIDILAQAAKRHLPNPKICKLPIADGGEGTVDALVTAMGGEYRYADVTGPLGDTVRAKYGILPGGAAVMEMAQASGIMLLGTEKLNPMRATTYGTGELLKTILDEGITRIIVGIGGSATNDGGIGAAQALGVSFVDTDRNEAAFGGGSLSAIKEISLERIDKRIKDTDITVICDVTNPLTGPNGATKVFGPQKGATPEMLERLEAGMVHYAGLIKAVLKIDADGIMGGGAAGGLGAALSCYFGAKMKPGIQTILDTVGFDSMLTDTSLVVTGEGRLDGQTAFGKAPAGIAQRCKAKGVPVVAFAGCLADGFEAVYDCGISGVFSCVSRLMDQNEMAKRAEKDLKDAADRLFRLIRIGMEIK